MAVPDTTTFNMQDVANAVDPSKTSFTDLITVANNQSPSKWDPAYSGAKNALLNFRNYDGLWVGRLVPISSVSPGNSSSWSNQVITLSSEYHGHDVRVVWKYTGGSSFTGDLQIGGNVTLGGTTFDLDTYTGTAWQTTRVDTAAYNTATFYDILTGTTGLRWNKRATFAPPSTGTGLAPPPYAGGDNTYYYAETTSPGYPSKRFWLRSPQVSISQLGSQINWWRGNYGATMGSYSIYLEIMT